MKKHIAAALLAGIAAVSLSPAMATAAPATAKNDTTVNLAAPHAGEGLLPCNTREWTEFLESDPNEYDNSNLASDMMKYMGCTWNDFFAGRGVNDQSNRPTPVDALK